MGFVFWLNIGSCNLFLVFFIILFKVGWDIYNFLVVFEKFWFLYIL